MGKRGPPKTPTKILKMRASPLAKQRAGEVVPPDNGEPEAPEWLNGRAFLKWKELAPILYKAGLLSEFDTEALARYCRLWQRWLECEEFIDENGVFYEKHGEIDVGYVRHPMAIEAGTIVKDLARLEAQFGLTPAARAGLKVEPTKPQRKTGLNRYTGGRSG